MKLSKTFGRVATTLVATAMLASLAVPAFADESQSDPNEGVVLETAAVETDINVTKTIVKPENVYLPDATFKFSLVPSQQENVMNGAVVIADKTIHSQPSDSDIGVTTVEIPDDTMTVHVNANMFTEPGEYEFTIRESEGYYEDSADNANDSGWAQQFMTLRVYIIRDGDQMKVYGYSLISYNGDEEIKVDTFTNEYMNGSTSGTPYTFTVDKTVAGNAATSAEKAAHYSFNLTIVNDATSTDKTYYVVVAHNGTNCNEQADTTYTVTEGDAEPISVAMGDKVTIYGLTKNDVISVTETGYTGNTPAGACDWDIFTVTNSATEAEGEQVTASNMAVTGVEANDKVTFTNTHTVSNPTGIVMDIAPYALLVVIAAAGCFVFLRKRRED